MPAASDLWLLPLRADSGYDITSTHDSRWGGFHYGVDLAVAFGTPYYAAHAGTVTVSRFYSGYGYAVVVEQPGGIEVRYGHSSRLLVAEGQRVQAGQMLGLVGCSGQCTGPHLHFEIRINGTADRQDGVPVDGIEFMLARGVDLVAHTETVR